MKEETTIRTNKEFPLEKGEVLRIKDGSGRIVEKWHIGDISHEHAFEREKGKVVRELTIVHERH
jgi:hypothetical protein